MYVNPCFVVVVLFIVFPLVYSCVQQCYAVMLLRCESILMNKCSGHAIQRAVQFFLNVL